MNYSRRVLAMTCLQFLPRICALNRSLNYEIFDLEESSSTNQSTHGTTAETTTVATLQNAVSSGNVAVPVVPAARPESSGGTLVLSHTSIEGASIGLWIDSEKVQVENARIMDSVVSNGSSYAIHIVEFPAAPLKSVQIVNVTVADQSRGHAGVLVTGGWAEEISIDRSTFTRNTVPSLIVALECHEQPSQTRLTNSTFINNEETVVHLDVGECGSLEVSRNSFLENNNSGQEGVLMVNAEPRGGSSSLPVSVEENEFAKNGGEYSVMLSMHGSHPANGSFRGNRLHDNINSVASVVLTSPHYRLESNEFSNPLSAHELDVRSDGSWKVQATGNSWGTDDVKKALKAPEGIFRAVFQKYYQIFLEFPSGSGSILMSPVKFASLPGAPAPIIPENSDNSQCAHLNFCSRVGKCEGASISRASNSHCYSGVCVCPLNYLGLDCSIPTGCPANCSNNGVCEMNKCICYDGEYLVSNLPYFPILFPGLILINFGA
ncbi:hypothetical protein ANCCAN_22862 [Ancylostoma caninum]|uniref:EGF-like domain-containing protein n=1 Tax=Ancylostoma caninum TaxID=29170 RepID=A0A368FGL8_ANCCA|nr:hypothetical protein ANCCAN_22862 [Ancylostoma caninum]